MNSNKILSKNLKQYREEHKMSQEELAHKAGISTRGYGEIERGKVHTSLDVVDKLVEATALSVDRLLYDKLDLSKENKEE